MKQNKKCSGTDLLNVATKLQTVDFYYSLNDCRPQLVQREKECDAHMKTTEPKTVRRKNVFVSTHSIQFNDNRKD